MLQKIKTKKFWISLSGIIIMLLQLFGVKVDVPYVNEVVNSICAVLILIGLLDPGKAESPSESETEGEGNDNPNFSEEKPSESETEGEVDNPVPDEGDEESQGSENENMKADGKTI